MSTQDERDILAKQTKTEINIKNAVALNIELQRVNRRMDEFELMSRNLLAQVAQMTQRLAASEQTNGALRAQLLGNKSTVH